MLSETEGKFLTMHEFAKSAKNRLDANIWDYLTGATETETTMRRNRLALDTLAFRPRVLRDVSNIDTTSEVFGKKIRLPVALAPVGAWKLRRQWRGHSGAGGFGLWRAADCFFRHQAWP